MLRGRLALASVSLCLVCLLGLTPPSVVSLPPCTRDLIRKVQELINKAPGLKWLNCRLYTPSIQDYQRCPRSTLQCFADEIKVLIDEWDTASVPGIHGSKLNLKLGKLAMKLNQTTTETRCLRCELLKEEEAEKFLKDLQSTLRVMNDQYSASCRP